MFGLRKSLPITKNAPISRSQAERVLSGLSISKLTDQRTRDHPHRVYSGKTFTASRHRPPNGNESQTITKLPEGWVHS